MKAKRPNITREQALEWVSYNPETGKFTFTAGFRSGREATSKDRKGYLLVCFLRKTFFAHRLAWLCVYGEWPDADIDHANGDILDNRISNLRPATRKENSRNRKHSAINTSGYRGVTWDKRKGKWRAKITVDSRTLNLGWFTDPVLASACYNAAAAKHFGEFAAATRTERNRK